MMLKLCIAFARHCGIFYYVTITLLICSMQLSFLMVLELRYILVSLNYLEELRYKLVMFYLCLFVTIK